MLELPDLYKEDFYLRANPDVAVAVRSGAFSSGLEHFLTFGQFEGRDPGPFFDTSFYLETYPDLLLASNQIPQFSPLQHLINFGQFEERDPITAFSTSWYLDANPDVAADVEADQLTPYQHYVQFGVNESRLGAPLNTIADLPTPIPLIVDDDGSQDGMTALAYVLQNPKFSVEAIAVSQGLAHPKIFGNNVTRMLSLLGKTGIPVGVGSEVPLFGNNAFPEMWRTDTDRFFAPFVQLPDNAEQTVDKRDAADLIINTVKQSPEPVAILATGSLTNIAEALRRDSTIIDNIAALQIMGGALFVPGNLRESPDPIVSQNTVAEFNIWTDPVAAQEVFSAGSKGLPIFLTPLDATNKIGFFRSNQQAWKATGTPESILASQLLDFALTNISGNDPLIPNPAWDLVAAINLSEPSFSEATPLHLEIDTDGELSKTQGQTVVVPGLPPNVQVYLNPSFEHLYFDPGELFGGA